MKCARPYLEDCTPGEPKYEYKQNVNGQHLKTKRVYCVHCGGELY